MVVAIAPAHKHSGDFDSCAAGGGAKIRELGDRR